MPSKSNQPELPLSLGQRPGLNHDSRTGLGYGLDKNTFHNSRHSSQEFPYVVNDPKDDEELEDLGLEANVAQRIKNKISSPYKSGECLICRSLDHTAMASGNRPVAIGEATAKGLVPFPGMYKKRVQSGGGVNSPKLVAPGQYNRTGTYRGWSHAPTDDNINIDYNEYDEESISLEKARKIVRKVLKNNAKSI